MVMSWLYKLLKLPVHFFYTGERALKLQNKQLDAAYYCSPAESDSREELASLPLPTIICMFDGRMGHGGLADRLHGMVSMFCYAKKHGMDFRIHYVYPFSLSNFLLPNEYQWEIEEDDISYDRSVSKPVWVAFSNNLFEPAFCRRYLRRQLKGYRQYHVYPSLKIAGKEFSHLYNELFKPSPLLQKELEQTLCNIGGKYITMSFRFVELLGDFKDCLHVTYTEAEREKLIEKCVAAIETVSKQAVLHRTIVVTSDSVTFLNRVKGLPGIYVIPGSVGHIDYQSNLEVHLKTFLDFYMIANAEEVYMMRTKEMYRSGFAKCAAMVYCKPFKEYVIE